MKIFFACNDKLDDATVKKLKVIERFLYWEPVEWYTTLEAFGANHIANTSKNSDFNIIDAPSHLFDMSRYSYFIEMENDNDVLILLNDTLGSGRKFGTGLFLYILISIILIKYNIYDIAAPLDRDQHGAWMSPYLVLGRRSVLSKLNWTNVAKANSNSSELEKINIENWLNEKWRSRKKVNSDKRSIKFNILLIERDLIRGADFKIKLFAFSRRNVLRIINSMSRIR